MDETSVVIKGKMQGDEEKQVKRGGETRREVIKNEVKGRMTTIRQVSERVWEIYRNGRGRTA